MTNAFLVSLVAACSPLEPATPVAPVTREPLPTLATQRATQPTTLADTVDPAFADTIREAAAPYLTWTRVDEKPNIAPSLCRMPMGDDYGKASHIRMSDADTSPHDRKLYFLYASAKWDYLSLSDAPRSLADGFTIVKESFHAVPAQPSAPRANERMEPVYSSEGKAPPPVTWVETGGGKRLAAGAPSGLYVMTKVGGPETAGTDAGWVYGTIAPNGTVTSAGRVATCMSCHEDAGDDRLFGLQPTKALVESPAPRERRR